VIGLMAMLVWRGLRTAAKARDGYGFLLAAGITIWLGFQALINMAVITAVIPFTGMPLPFLSYGGSSMATSVVGVAILLSISRDATMDIKIQHPRKGESGTKRETIDMRRRNRWPHLSSVGRRR
jgi:cell division protein FtsW